jgi:hypothetical protein
MPGSYLIHCAKRRRKKTYCHRDSLIHEPEHIGFVPGQTTLLPIQPESKAYKLLDELRIEIPTLGINFPIVSVSYPKTNGILPG